MSGAVVLKKVAVTLIQDSKAGKVIGEILLGIVIVIVMPVAALLGILRGDITVDTGKLAQKVEESITEEERMQLLCVEKVMAEIENKMPLSEYTDWQVEKAKFLCVFALEDFVTEEGFVDQLVGCFWEEQTEEELMETVNATFGTTIRKEDFIMVRLNEFEEKPIDILEAE